MTRSTGLFPAAQTQAQALILGVITAATLILVTLTAGAALGIVPWLDLYAGAGGTVLPQAGMYAQIAVTGLFVALALYLPANRRIMRLETSHRNFNLSMDDVMQAYMASHAADRQGVFKIGGEFDSVRDRITYLQEHPDLGSLEPEVLELAAQMSHTSRDIAEVYSEERVARARQFLRQRQEEMEQFQQNLAIAKKSTEDLKQWMQQLDTEQCIVDNQVATLKKDLKAILPAIGMELDDHRPSAARTVVPMTHKSQLSNGRPVLPQKPDR